MNTNNGSFVLAVNMALAAELAANGIVSTELPWDEHQEITIFDPLKTLADDPLKLAEVAEMPVILGYFMHYDRDDNRRWYAHTNWHLDPEYAAILAKIKALEGQHHELESQALR